MKPYTWSVSKHQYPMFAEKIERPLESGEAMVKRMVVSHGNCVDMVLREQFNVPFRGDENLRKRRSMS